MTISTVLDSFTKYNLITLDRRERFKTLYLPTSGTERLKWEQKFGI